MKPLTATNLAGYQYSRCDLYIHNVYHESTALGQTQEASEVTKAHFKRGLDWETSLFAWLDQSNLLLKVPSHPLDPNGLLENILADERSHFFVAGLTFWPPQQDLNKRFSDEKREPLTFGLAKPDLLEIRKVGQQVLWRVIDAKASKHVTTSHQIQVYFYTLCLKSLLQYPPYQSADMAGVWLPRDEIYKDVTPSIHGVKTFSITLLAPSFDAILFKELPKVLGLPYSEVKRHYNPLCHGCRYEPECRRRALVEGELGSMPNISVDDAKILQEVLRISRVTKTRQMESRLPDIEELHLIFEDPTKLDLLAKFPTVIRKAKQILSIPRKTSSVRSALRSPAVEAARTQEIQVIPRRNCRCPSKEHIAIIISAISDPSSPSIGGDYFTVTVHSEHAFTVRPPAFACPSSELISTLANFIRAVDSAYSVCSANSCQFYVWSVAEHDALQNTITRAALTSSVSKEDIQLCIGALAQGASLLQTTFQPLLLSGALLGFLANGKRTQDEYKVFLERMGLPTEGTLETLRQRIDNELRKLKGMSEASGHNGDRRGLDQVPPIVVLKKEIERQLALPIPGYWDLPECARLLLAEKPSCPGNEQIWAAYRDMANDGALQELLFRRNRIIYQVLFSFRARATTASGTSYLFNEAKILSSRFMDICKEVNLRKLFFMQQFEVMTKLTELWQSRADGCPDAPVIQYVDVVQGPNGPEYIFEVMSGLISDPVSEREFSFFDKLLVRDVQSATANDEDIPVEALFDDLGVSGVVFPLNRYTNRIWAKQDQRVQAELVVADVRNVDTSSDRQHTMVRLRIWGTGDLMFRRGEKYRLSSRFVDFNTVKILSALLEIDLLWDLGHTVSQHDDLQRNIPFLQLITDPDSLGNLPMAKQYLKTENHIQDFFRGLAELGNVPAKSLMLTASQHKAAKQILSNRLSIVWGPPGTGKTHVISLSILRVIDVERRHHGPQPKIIFMTALTNAAIQACYRKIVHLIELHRSIASLPKDWLGDLQVQIVTRGNGHLPPAMTSSSVLLYAGTVYQLYNFAKKHSIRVDCVIVDEAGQMLLNLISLIIRFLNSRGRIIIAGDSEQLAPILSAKYPALQPRPLFGSILDCLMHPKPVQKEIAFLSPAFGNIDEVGTSSQGTIIQLAENFRLNSDLSDFISTIYSRRFKPQKVQTRKLSEALAVADKLQSQTTGYPEELTRPLRAFLLALSNVMLKKGVPKDVLMPPSIYPTSVDDTSKSSLTYRPASLSLIRLRSWSKQPLGIPYEMHVHVEAAVAAALVRLLQACCPTDDIFVATPYRIQREAVKQALAKAMASDSLQEVFDRLEIGSEASIVLCLFSLPKSVAADHLDFLLDRRRLNVALSRAKNLCILIGSDEILCPPVKILAKEGTAKGYAFLKAYQQRAWSYYLPVQAEKVL